MGPTVVVGPDGGEIEFPEGMDDAAINAAMLQIYPPAAPRAAAPARQPAAAPQRPVDPGYPETYNPAPGLIATTPGAPLQPASAALAAGRPPRSVGQRFLGNLADTFQTGWMAEGFREGAQAGARGFEPDRSFIPNPARSAGAVVNAFRQIFDPAGATAYAEGLIGQERARRGQFAAVSRDDPFYRAPGGPVDVALAGLGTAGGVLAGAALDPLSYVSPGRTVAQRALAQGGLSFATDAAAQGSGMATGLQEDYDARRALISAGTGAAFSAGADVLGMGINRMFPRAAAPVDGGPTAPAAAPEPEVRIDPETGRPYVTTASVDITPAEADALVAAGTHRRDPATGAVYRYVGATDQAPAASLPDVEVTAAAPGAGERMPMQGDAPSFMQAAVAAKGGDAPAAATADARIAAARKELADVNAALAAVEGDVIPGELLARRDAARAELSAAVEPPVVRPPEAPAPDDFGPLRPPEARTLAEDVGAPGRAPDQVMLGPEVRALDDEFGIPPQPSAAVARAAEADLTLRAPAADRADPDLVGNIRLSNLNSEQDIARVLETARVAGGDFVEARRGTQSFDDIEALAADLDMTADTLLKRRGGQAFNAEEITAARGLLVASAERVDDIARRIDEAVEPGDALNAEFHEAILRHVAIQEQVAGIKAEAGRALGVMRMLANSDNVTPEMLASVLGGGMNVKDAARAIRQAGTRNPKARARAIKAAIKPTFTDMLVEYWYNSILSGPATHIVNILSNTLTALNQLPEFAAAAAFGGARRLLNIGPSERVLGTEVGQRAVGMLSGVVEGARAFADTLATGNVSDGVTKIEVAQQRAIPGVAGTIIRTPGRFLAAEDELFKAIARRMQINGLATRIAHQDGLRGEAAVARAAELSANPTKEMMEEANNYARYITFQDPMGRIGRGAMQMTSGAGGILKLVVPFVRTPINLMKQTVERSPFAFVLKSWREDVKAGGVRGDLALAKAAVGTGYGLAIALAAQQGNITGAAPTDRAEREALLATGWQPFSLKVGDNYYSYRRLDPLGTLVGIAATMGQPHLFAGEREGAEKRFVVGFLAMLSDKTFMSGISDLVAAVDDPSGRRAEAYLNRLMGSVLVPFSAAVSQTAKALDPTSRVAENIPDVVRSRIPGMSQDLPARYDVLGREGRTSPGGFEAFSPVTRSPVRDDPVANMILDSGVRITPPNRTIKGTRLSAEVYSQYQAEAGAQIRNNMAWYTENPQVWNSMSQEERADETKRQVDRARETARQNLGL